MYSPVPTPQDYYTWALTTPLKGLPEGAVVIEVMAWAVSGWTQTFRVTTELPDGEIQEYFLKTSSEDFAEVMFKGEFHSLDAMHNLMPDSCPKPRGWGQYKSALGTFFVVMDFLHLSDEDPDPEKISRLISDLHKRTQGTSPENKFGFHVPSCHGMIVTPNEWDEDWTRYFTKLITIFHDEDMKVNGPSPGYQETFTTLKQHVIPRLLEALQAEGRVLSPCLVHGDLWQENIGSNVETDEPMIYDPNVFYAHNEYELGMWRASFVPFDESYRKQYCMLFPPSEPTNEWDDRNRLYSLVFDISHSAHWRGQVDGVRPV
jgi:protein-ribulosamine 3-kinase